ncbi:NAD-binding protein [Streptacidiphilus sp. EB129]|uniref:NAD-binding protein n=1 Tax=Streptacidiphilus sp. EB129 TaxID=3156262 RepID=UPI003512D3DE
MTEQLAAAVPDGVTEPTGPPPAQVGHMIVCGGDALTHRVALDLIHLYRERVTLVIPDPDQGHGPQLAALATADGTVTVIAGRSPDEPTLLAAGITDATALALTIDHDPTVTQAALLARGLNPRLRLVIRIFNNALGVRLERLLDRTASANGGSTAVLSASETATPALVSAAVTGRNQVIPVNGGTLSVVEQPVEEGAAEAAALARGGAVPLALLAPRSNDLLGSGTTPLHPLLPSQTRTAGVRAQSTRAVLWLRHDPSEPDPPAPRFRRPAWGALFSRRLRLAGLGLAALVAVLTLATWLSTDNSLPLSLYLVLMDVAAMGNPALGQPLARQLLQLLAAFTGMLIMPLVLALVLENLGALRTIGPLNRPLRTTSDHIVIIGLGKVGTRVLERLVDLRVPVVAVERDPEAAGVSLARKRNVPVVIGDISQPEVYRAARIGRSSTLMALTSNDSVNLEAVLYARERRPDLRVVLRLFDDAFATTVYQALRASYPQAPTRSRSVSYLAAPAFAAAMMGRQVLAAIPVERQMLLVATVNVRGREELEGRTVARAFRPGGWRVVGLLSGSGRLTWGPAESRVLQGEDRVIVVATREGLGLLLQRSQAEESAFARAWAAAERRNAEPAPAGSPQPVPQGQAGPGPVPAGSPSGAPAGPLGGLAGTEQTPVPLPRLPRAEPSPPYQNDQAEGPSR